MNFLTRLHRSPDTEKVSKANNLWYVQGEYDLRNGERLVKHILQKGSGLSDSFLTANSDEPVNFLERAL